MQYPTIEDWLIKLWYVHTMEYHEAVKGKEGGKSSCADMERSTRYLVK